MIDATVGFSDRERRANPARGVTIITPSSLNSVVYPVPTDTDRIAIPWQGGVTFEAQK